MPDHAHMMISIPPKYAVSQVIGFIKGKSAIHLARVYGERKRNFVGQHFWARGYFVSTVGRDETAIREYIRNQENEDKRLDHPLIRELAQFIGPHLWGRRLHDLAQRWWLYLCRHVWARDNRRDDPPEHSARPVHASPKPRQRAPKRRSILRLCRRSAGSTDFVFLAALCWLDQHDGSLGTQLGCCAVARLAIRLGRRGGRRLLRQ